MAQTKTWTGDINNDWSNPNNWSPTGVPTTSANVKIYSQTNKPLPQISNSDVTVQSVQLSDYRVGGLTVTNNRTLTITNGLSWNDNGYLTISNGGTVHLSGGSFNMGYGGNSSISISNGSFISDVSVQLKGSGITSGTNLNIDINGNLTMANGTPFTIQSGTVDVSGDATVNGPYALGALTFTVGGKLTINSGKKIDVESANITIQGATEINGTFNGDDGITNFNGYTEVKSGGMINLDSGEIHFNNGSFIGSNGTTNLGSGTAEFQGDVTVVSGGYLNVQDATVNITGDANFISNGNLSIEEGSINVVGNASLSSGGQFNLNTGSFNVGGDASFTNGGTVNAGNSQMDLKGDLTLSGGGTFNSGTSTVTFSGDETQAINTNGADLTFYNVKIDSGSSVQTDGSTQNTITVQNNLTVEDGASVSVEGDDTIDVQGEINGNGTVQSPRPFIYSISTPDLMTVIVTYDQAMGPSAGVAGNYSINNGITVSSASFSSSDPAKITLTVSTLTQGTQYELTVNSNVQSSQGKSLSSNHIKRFTVKTQKTYYSRTSGPWNAPNSWSLSSHTGSAASSIPNSQSGNKVEIGNGNTITVGSSQDISGLAEIDVENSGKLQVSSSGSLTLNNLIIPGNGSFSVKAGGTLQIGSPAGITAQGTNAGNIQTTLRAFSNQGNYVYSGTSTQQTGSGLPQQVNNLTINNTAGVTGSNSIHTTGTLILQNGSLIIPSGQQLISNSKTIQNGDLIFKRILSGSPGWRMLSSPIDASYNNFLSGILTQGYEGTEYQDLQPNVLYYDETYEGTDNQRWRAPASGSTSVAAGTGYFAYLFGDVSSDDRYNDSLPDTLVVEGQEFEGSGDVFDFNVTFTPKGDAGWNLVGNPFGASIDWDNSGNWTKTNMDNTIYVWDPDDESYKTWNGSTGSLGDGRIAPFQAFWVKADTTEPRLSVNKDAKTIGGSFVGKRAGDSDDIPKLELKLTNGTNVNRIFFMFSEDGQRGKDANDAYYLQRPPGISSYSELYSVAGNGSQFVINALPREFGIPIEIPVAAHVYDNGISQSENLNLSFASVKNLPAGWTISLVDRKTGKTIATGNNSSLNFAVQSQKRIKSTVKTSEANARNAHSMQGNYKILAESDPDKARFLLRIDPGTDAAGLPTKVALNQNYPNPVETTTTIPFNLPLQDQVTIQIYDILGRLIDTVVKDKTYPADFHSEGWDATSVSSGVYIYVLRTSNKVISKKLTVIK